MPIRFKIIPNLIISFMAISPDPKTMALGGVATGSIKAQDAESVAGIINNRGLTFIAVAKEPKIGRNISVVAVLEVSSVKKVNVVQTDATIINGGKSSTPLMLSPNHCDNPDSLNPLARAKPPPKSKTIPQFNFEAVFQFIRHLVSDDFAGMINKSKAIDMAIVPSSINFGTGKRLDQPGITNVPRSIFCLKINNRAMMEKRVNTIDSS